MYAKMLEEQLSLIGLQGKVDKTLKMQKNTLLYDIWKQPTDIALGGQCKNPLKKSKSPKSL